MEVRETGIDGLVILEPGVYEDGRGYFFESYREDWLASLGEQFSFVQDNQSRSVKGVIRGLHYQKSPHAQTKLIRVIEGNIFDVAVDLREGSSTHGQWFGIELSEDNRLQLLVPRGFAHGFSVQSSYATVLYKCDAYYNRESEGGIRFDDPRLGIDWKVDASNAIVSEKDMSLPNLNPEGY